MKLLLDSQRISEYAVLKIHNCRLFHDCTSSLFEGPVGWIFIHVVVAIFNGVELQDESVTDAILTK